MSTRTSLITSLSKLLTAEEVDFKLRLRLDRENILIQKRDMLALNTRTKKLNTCTIIEYQIFFLF